MTPDGRTSWPAPTAAASGRCASRRCTHSGARGTARGSRPPRCEHEGACMISARGLTRTFNTKSGPVEAVRGIDLDVAEGEIVGLLGPNGAGKTTTLRMLTTLLAPSGGHGDGRRPRPAPRAARGAPRASATSRRSARRPAPGTRVGEELSPRRGCRACPRPTAARAARRARRRSLDLGGLEDRALLELSGGQRRRFDIALGLMHSPRAGLPRRADRRARPAEPRQPLGAHPRRCATTPASTVVLTTHYLEEADALADRILVMDDGQIVANDTAGRAQGRHRRRRGHARRSTASPRPRCERPRLARRGARRPREDRTRGTLHASPSRQGDRRRRRCCARWTRPGSPSASVDGQPAQRSTTSSSP